MDRFISPQPKDKNQVEHQSHEYLSRALTQAEYPIAQRLIYQVFVEEMGWIPELNNPSGIRFKAGKEGLFFVDHYDSHALWFGTFHHDRLIACWRFCTPLDDRFELEHYHSIPNFLKQSKSLEVTRLVIHSNYRRISKILLHLAQSTYQKIWQTYDYVFTAVTFPDPGRLYLKLGAKRLDLPAFKYSPSDPSEVSLITLDLKDRTTLVSGNSNSLKSSQSLIL